MTLQHAFIREVDVDIVGRVMDALRETTGLPVRLAKEEDREYFAGLLRVMDNAVQCHADFAPHVCASPVLSPPFPLSHLASSTTSGFDRGIQYTSTMYQFGTKL